MPIGLTMRRMTMLAGSLLILHVAPTHATSASPLLRCQVTYADSTQIIEARLTDDPYSAPAVDIAGRFRFKAVMVGAKDKIDYIKLYAYFQQRRKDLPIHQATYLPADLPAAFSGTASPFHTTTAMTFTPMNHLYAGDAERELQYQCTLQRVSP